MPRNPISEYYLHTFRVDFVSAFVERRNAHHVTYVLVELQADC